MPTGSVRQCNIIENGEYALELVGQSEIEVEIDATDNWWGIADSSLIESLVYHHNDITYYPPVYYVPFAYGPFDIDDTTAVDVGEPDDDVLPNRFALDQNYPNPFNPSTNINFRLPTASFVDLSVYNILGRKIMTLAGGMYRAGNYTITWDGCDEAGCAVAGGVYFYRLRAGGADLSRKMLLLK